MEDHIESSDEDEFLEERAGTSKKHQFLSMRPVSLPVDAWHYSSFFHSSFTHHQNPSHHYHHQHQPDLLREVLMLKKQVSAPGPAPSSDDIAFTDHSVGNGQKLKLSSTETDLQSFFGSCTTFGSLYCNARRKHAHRNSECESRAYMRRQSRSIENLRYEDEARLRRKYRSCLMQ